MRHDTATVGDAARKAAERSAGLALDAIEQAFGLKAPNGRAATQKAVADIMQQFTAAAISASERELVEALEPVIAALARYHDINNKRDEFLLFWLSTGKETVTLTAGMVRAARAALAKRGR